MSISIQITKNIPPARMIELYGYAGWLEPDTDPGYVQKMLDGTFAVAAAFDGDYLIGMARALSDGVSDAYVLDVIVDPRFRKQGIGGSIVNALTEHLAGLGVDWITAIGAPGTENFYHKSTKAKELNGHLPYRFFHGAENE